MSSIGGGLTQRLDPRIPHTLSSGSLEIIRFDFENSWRTEINNIYISVNSWVKRFESESIKGLETRPGCRRKPITDFSDEESVRVAIENDRQSIKKAKEAWQQASVKDASESTFRASLSALARDIDV